MALDLGIFLQGSSNSNKVKVTDNDALAQYLKDKITSVDASVTITERNDGGVETLDLAVGGSSDTNIANTNLTNDANRVVDLNGFKTGFTGGELGVGGALPDDSAQLDVSSTDKGLLIPRVTTVQMNAIVSPATNLLVFNTDLEALYRHDGLTWVALSAGYGVFALYSEGNGGVPTYYATFESALNETKTGDLHHTIKFYDNYEATSQINIKSADGFDFKSLTIDLNGFKLYNHQADGDDLIEFKFENVATENQQIIFLNGTLERLNATSIAYTLFANNTWGGLRMSNCTVINDTYEAAFLQINEPTVSQVNESNAYQDLGGSIFISESDYGIWLVEGRYKNFIGISDTRWGVYHDAEEAINFKAISRTAIGAYIRGNAKDFIGISEAGNGVVIANNSLTTYVSSFIGICEGSAYGVQVSTAGAIIDNFKAYSESGYALFVGVDSYISNGQVISNSSTYTASISNNARVNNVNFLNISGNYAALLRQDSHVSNCTFTSLTGVSALIEDDVYVSNSKFKSEWNNASGHAVTFTSVTNPTYLSLCKFEVANASANCLYSAIAVTVNASNNVYGATATTPVNANVTITATGTADSYGNIQE